jgi:hypothetical protein
MRTMQIACLAWLAVAPAAATTTTLLTGKITAVAGDEIRIALDGPLDPRPGDAVEVQFQIPGGPKILVGRWTVSRVDNGIVVAAKVEATGAPAVDQVATIHSLAPQRRSSAGEVPAVGGVDGATWTATATGTARLSHRGREVEARWQRETSGGRAVDTYYFPTPPAGDVVPAVNGQPLWNRFVRDPADDFPDQTGATWWLSVWENIDGTWRQRDTRDEPVELLARTPAP